MAKSGLIRRWRTRFSLCLSAAAVSAVPCAQAEENEKLQLSLSDCITRVLSHHPLLSSKEQETEMARAQNAAVSGRRWPTISARLFTGPVPEARGNAIMTETPVDEVDSLFGGLGIFFRAEAKIIQPLWTFGKISYADEGTKQIIKLKESEHRALEWKLRTDTKLLFYGIHFLHQVQALIDDIQKKSEAAEKLLKAQIKKRTKGVNPRDRFKLKVFDAEIENREIEAQLRLAELRDAMTKMLGLSSEGLWQLKSLSKARPRRESATVAALIHEAVAQDERLKQIDFGIQALEAQKRFQKAMYYPDLFLAGQARYAVAPNRDDQTSPFAVDNFNFFDFGITLGLNFKWDVGIRHNVVDQAEAELASFVAKRKALIEGIRHSAFQGYGRVEARQKQIKVKKKAFRAARSWSTSAMNGLQLGTGSIKDVIDGLSAHIKVKFEYLELSFEEKKALAELSSRLGRDIEPELLNETR